MQKDDRSFTEDPPEVLLRKRLKRFVDDERKSGLAEYIVQDKLKLRLSAETHKIVQRRERAHLYLLLSCTLTIGGLIAAFVASAPLCAVGGIICLIGSFAVTMLITDHISTEKLLMEVELFADEQGVSRDHE